MNNKDSGVETFKSLIIAYAGITTIAFMVLLSEHVIPADNTPIIWKLDSMMLYLSVLIIGEILLGIIYPYFDMKKRNKQ